MEVVFSSTDYEFPLRLCSWLRGLDLWVRNRVSSPWLSLGEVSYRPLSKVSALTKKTSSSALHVFYGAPFLRGLESR